MKLNDVLNVLIIYYYDYSYIIYYNSYFCVIAEFASLVKA